VRWIHRHPAARLSHNDVMAHGRQRDLHMTSKDTGATGGRLLDELHVLGAAAVTPLGLRRGAYAVLVGRGLARRVSLCCGEGE